MRMKLLAATAALATLGMASGASAAIVLTSVPGTNPYSGPTPTFTFDSGAPAEATGGQVRFGSVSGVAAQPFGSTGGYWTVGPSDGSPGILNLSAFASIGQISFIWGSVDDFNTLEVLGRDLTTVLASFTGFDAAVNPNGNQSSPITNPLAYLTITGADQFNIGALRLSSSRNAFEVDNIAIQAAVPEPGTWALMLLGFGFIGASMRARKTREVRVRYAL
ncbi:PEP-CTERM sorting domain-containing protein [Erythrobacteraceae bacterium CFH 75059]|uniref:Npun_F0296 family exosortase-dependent surface protein n=1 Tax=Qipengyuania thermophila TaxID=2509361 RepID=UPI00102273FA|nr:PEPxxWA-CTERM sorting domain-containing protein [Qipengyuania thermophila]TCD06537.1 PEP-CTERM sorting domain-containing protein [Erythrobacteraceae bacterium CFH 75059]